MSNHLKARRAVAVVLATAGLVGTAATTASAHSQPRHSSRVEIVNVDPGRRHHHHHHDGTVTLLNEGRRTADLKGWSLCDQDFNCSKIQDHLYLKGHSKVTLPMRDLDRWDRWVLLFNDHKRFVDAARVPHWHH